MTSSSPSPTPTRRPAAGQWSYETHELSEGYSSIVYDERGQKIADHLTEDRAALIAAAPDLLAALEAARVVVEAEGARATLAIIDAALERARG